MITAWIGALMIGLSLGLLGSGGSVLTVPILVYLVGQHEKVAIAGSLAIVDGISLIGALPYALQQRVDWKSVIFFGLPGMGGTYLGAYLARYVSGTVQLILFAVIMVLAGVMMLRPRTCEETRHQPQASWKIMLEGLAVGMVTGLGGVGGGFLIVPALVLLGGLPMPIAVGTSLLIIALKSFSGLYKYLHVLAVLDLRLDWEMLGVFTVIGVIGGDWSATSLAPGCPRPRYVAPSHTSSSPWAALCSGTISRGCLASALSILKIGIPSVRLVDDTKAYQGGCPCKKSILFA